MAVYTNISEQDIKDYLQNFNVGELTDFKGITAGVENTNYFVYTTQNTYVLTIFEKRTNVDELPYFINVMNHMSKKGINCPNVIENKNGKTLNDIVGKKSILISFLSGSSVEGNTNKNHTNSVGDVLANMHNATKDFNQNRINSMNLDGMINIFNDIKDKLDTEYFDTINNEIEYQKQNKIDDLPTGASHLDLFVDNVFFNLETEKVSGVIDFYFTADDTYAYDLAITINAWCFKVFESMDLEMAKSMINGYEQNRKLSDSEKNALPDLLRLASLRFLLTRSYDKINTPAGADVVVKDPMEYLQKLKYCQSITTGDLF